MTETWDVIIIGAGASGLMCAARAAGRGRKTLLLEQGGRPARKVLLAGGGKCNFTNLSVEPDNYVSANPHFCRSALSRYTQWDFLALLEKYRIRWEERGHGQLFAAGSALEIRDMLVGEARNAGAAIKTGISVISAKKETDGGFSVSTSPSAGGKPSEVSQWRAESLVAATGGVSWPSAGTSPLGYRIASEFGIPVMPVSPGLVPLTLTPDDMNRYAPLTGIAVDAEVSVGSRSFRDSLLFTHHGLSGPVILQASNRWKAGEALYINLIPGQSAEKILREARNRSPGSRIGTVVSGLLPKRLTAAVIDENLAERTVRSMTPAETSELSDSLSRLRVVPAGTGGYRRAEVTRGGVDVDAVSSKTFETRSVPGLYFIGEVLDVTGDLGGYNLQWAWSSGWCAGGFV